MAAVKALQADFQIGRTINVPRGNGIVRGKILQTSIHSRIGSRVKVIGANGKQFWVYLDWFSA